METRSASVPKGAPEGEDRRHSRQLGPAVVGMAMLLIQRQFGNGKGASDCVVDPVAASRLCSVEPSSSEKWDALWTARPEVIPRGPGNILLP